MVAANGRGLDGFFTSLRQGRTGLRTIQRFDTSSLATRIGGEIDLETLEFPPALKKGYMWNRVQDAKAFLMWEAIRQIRSLIPKHCGLISTIGLERVDLDVLTGKTHDQKPVCPEVPPTILPELLWKTAGFSGPVWLQVSACAAGTIALGTAFRAIRNGACDVLVAGGADSLLFPYGIHAFNSLGALSEKNELGAKALAPFDKHRSGTLLGEGAAYLLLEEFEHARARRRRPLAEVFGFGASMDAYHPVMPDPSGQGAEQAMRNALADGGISAEKIDYINAHGTGTFHNDLMESKAILSVFGDRGRTLPVSSSKTFFGHLLTAAGAVEAAATLLPLIEDIIPPTLHFQTPDPDIPLDCVPNQSRKGEVRLAMTNSYGLGGQNASLIIGKPV